MRPILTCFILCLSLSAGLPAAAQQASARLTVEGRGEVAMVPDMATITLSVTREAVTAAEAMDALAAASTTVLDRVTAEGLPARDVQTGQISLQPQWDQSEGRRTPAITGYVARTTVTLRVRDLGTLGGLLDAVVADGANGLDGLQFGLNDPRPAEDEARAAAVADALARAQVYAAAAGLAVGPILSLAEAGTSVPGPMMMEMAAARSMPVAAGEVTQAATVTLVVELVTP